MEAPKVIQEIDVPVYENGNLCINSKDKVTININGLDRESTSRQEELLDPVNKHSDAGIVIQEGYLSEENPDNERIITRNIIFTSSTDCSRIDAGTGLSDVPNKIIFTKNAKRMISDNFKEIRYVGQTQQVPTTELLLSEKSYEVSVLYRFTDSPKVFIQLGFPEIIPYSHDNVSRSPLLKVGAFLNSNGYNSSDRLYTRVNIIQEFGITTKYPNFAGIKGVYFKDGLVFLVLRTSKNDSINININSGMWTEYHNGSEIINLHTICKTGNLDDLSSLTTSKDITVSNFDGTRTDYNSTIVKPDGIRFVRGNGSSSTPVDLSIESNGRLNASKGISINCMPPSSYLNAIINLYGGLLASSVLSPYVSRSSKTLNSTDDTWKRNLFESGCQSSQSSKDEPDIRYFKSRTFFITNADGGDAYVSSSPNTKYNIWIPVISGTYTIEGYTYSYTERQFTIYEMLTNDNWSSYRFINSTNNRTTPYNLGRFNDLNRAGASIVTIHGITMSTYWNGDGTTISYYIDIIEMSDTDVRTSRRFYIQHALNQKLWTHKPEVNLNFARVNKDLKIYDLNLGTV